MDVHYRFRSAQIPDALVRFFAVALSLALLSIDAVAEVRLLNDGRPVQVRVSEPFSDLNHRDEIDRLQSINPPFRDADASRPEGVAEPPLLQLPLRRGFVNKNPGVFGINAFVDLDEAHPDMLLDYNCGERTYDTEDLDHNGIDYTSSVFPWLTMANDGLVAVAAADGTIITRHDGEFDQQCAFSESARSNLIELQHDDGSITIYGHMKKGTVTSRRVGDRVEAGDYLGVIGSSGFSNGPHLHLGVYDSGGSLIEPSAGACNNLNSNSWWAEQEDYYVKTINAVRSHSAEPEYPPCPGVEVPHYNDEFKTGEIIYLSAFVRDFLREDSILLEILSPSNEVLLQTTYEQNDFDHAPAFWLVFGIEFSSEPPSGAYTWVVTYAGNTMQHTFYINAQAPPPPTAAVVANNAYNGLWYDSALDGEGYNIVTADGGTIVYFYGSDLRGNRLWLISDLLYGPITDGQLIEIEMYESTGGVFGSPVSSARGLSLWGKLRLVFTACGSGQATLSGVDGDKLSQITKLAGVAGTACTSGAAPPDAAWSGLWFDAGLDGEGYNLLVAPSGRILYYYGFKTSGLRLWLISDLITEELQVGKSVVIDVYEATQGVFSTPVSSNEALVKWGTATITLIDCDHVTIVLTGSDGSKTSNTVRLAGIIGLQCR